MNKILRVTYRWLFPACLVGAGCGLAFVLHAVTGLPVADAWKEGAAAIVTVGFFCLTGVWAVRMYPTKAGILIYAQLTGIILGLMAAWLDVQLLHAWLTAGNTAINGWVRRTILDRYIISLSLILSCTIISAMNRRLREMEGRFRKNADAEVLLRDAELFKLRQQLQPHFLYNSLNAISALVLIDADRAQEMTGRLSDFLRASVRREVADILPVADELDYLQTYLAIETIRFGDRLQVQFEQDFTDSARMPPFLLQPVMENAIKFGLYGNTGNVLIQVSISLEESLLQIVITNPYDATLKPPSGTGFGLDGIRRRLYLLYGRQDLLETKTSGEQFITTIKIPQAYVQSDSH